MACYFSHRLVDKNTDASIRMTIGFLLWLVLLIIAEPCLAQTSGWVFPNTSTYAASGATNGRFLSTENVPGASITVTLPSPTVVGQGWQMGFSEANNRGAVVNAPGGVYILSGQKAFTSFTVPSNTNYEQFVLQSDGTNFRITSATDATARYNGIVGTVGGQVWNRLYSTGYASTLGDNGTVLDSTFAGGPVIITLPPTPLLPNGWTITPNANVNTIRIVLNSVSGGTLVNNQGVPVTSYVVAKEAAPITFDGTSFHVLSGPASTPSDYGADVTGIMDSTAALNACLTAVGPGGTCKVNRGATLMLLGNVTVPDRTTLDCGFDSAFYAVTLSGPALHLDSGHSILFGPSATVQNCLIVPNGMVFPQPSSSGYAGTAINTQGSIAPKVVNTTIVGFDTAINAYGSNGIYLDQIYADGNGVTNGGVIVTGNNGDSGFIVNTKIQVLGTSTGCPARLRPGTGLFLNSDGGEFLDNIVSQDFQVADFRFNNTAAIMAGRLWADFNFAGGCPRGTSVGMLLYSTNAIHITHLDLDGMQTGLVILTDDDETTTYLGSVFLNIIGGDGIQIGSGSHGGGYVHINDLRTNANAVNVGGYAINYLDYTYGASLTLDQAFLVGVNGITAPYIKIPQNVFTYRIKIGEDIMNDIGPAVYGYPTFVSCSGLGTGVCTFLASNRTTPWQGTVILNPAGGPSSSGTVVLGWPLTLPHNNGCITQLESGSAGWIEPGSTTQVSSVNNTETQFMWSNGGTALSPGSTYYMVFSCNPQ